MKESLKAVPQVYCEKCKKFCNWVPAGEPNVWYQTMDEDVFVCPSCGEYITLVSAMAKFRAALAPPKKE